MGPMEADFSPKFPQRLFEGDGGSYHLWLASDMPMLEEAKVAAGKLLLHPGGLALPHAADSSKIGLVIEGCGRAGLVSPNCREKVVKLNIGDAILVPSGVTSWWYNDGDSEFVVVFLGESRIGGAFSYLFLAGVNGIFSGFSSKFLSRALNLDEETTNKLAKSQTGQLIVKAREGTRLPNPREEDAVGIVFNFITATRKINVGKGGHLFPLTSIDFPARWKEIGLSAFLVKLDSSAAWPPEFSDKSEIQVIYVLRGSGQVEMVDFNGNRVLEAKVSAGCLFLVPGLFVISGIADVGGMEWFFIVKDPRPGLSFLAGETSVLNALSPQLLEASLNVPPKLVKRLISEPAEVQDDVIFSPPPN